MKTALTLLFSWTLLISATSSGQPTQKDHSLFPVKVADRWGYIDRKGHIVIPPAYAAAEDFSEGLAHVSSELKMEWREGIGTVKGKYGFIDTTGTMVIEPKYESASSFSNGRARVCIGEKWGFIDRNGNLITSFEFDDAHDFHEGLARVLCNEETVYDSSFNLPRPIPVKRGGLYGYIDTSGVLIIKQQFRYATNFCEGRASASKGNLDGIIDRTGNFICYGYKVSDSTHISPITSYDSAMKPSELVFPDLEYHDGLARTRWNVPKRQYGFVNRDGLISIQPQYEYADIFSEGLASVDVQPEGRRGYIDTTGTIVIKPQFTVAGPFHGGLAPVTCDSLLLSEDDYKKKFLEISKHVSSEEELMAVIDKFNKEYRAKSKGYIDKTGRWIFQYPQELVRDILSEENLGDIIRVLVGSTGEYYYFDNNGTMLWPQRE